ncbi:hypothetical protein NL386_37880, partial [Klebsiella pneumoniae]|nr:hypothetical protein [Klebsiella pneumoniae]
RLMYKYDTENNRWELIAGHGDAGYCPDGTAVIGSENPTENSCRILPEAMFVDSRGRVYFVDQGQIRVLLDPEDPAKPYVRKVLT